MALMSRASEALQWWVQREAKGRPGANPGKPTVCGLQSGTRLHEVGIASNGGSATPP